VGTLLQGQPGSGAHASEGDADQLTDHDLGGVLQLVIDLPQRARSPRSEVQADFWNPTGERLVALLNRRVKSGELRSGQCSGADCLGGKLT
jgi:hypothetical protein